MSAGQALKVRTLKDLAKLRRSVGDKAVLNWRDKKGGSLLHVLAERGGSAEAAQAAIQMGFDVNLQRSRDLNSPLHLATFFKNTGVARVLIQAGAKKELRNKYGETCVVGQSSYEQSLIAHKLESHKSGAWGEEKGYQVVVDENVLSSLSPQELPTTCSAASLSTATRYLQRLREDQVSQSDVIRDMDYNPEKGLSYSQHIEATKRFVETRKYPWTVTPRAGSNDLEAFRETLVADLTSHFPVNSPVPDRHSIILVNFVRAYQGKIGGHWSPLAGVRWKLANRQSGESYPTHVLIAETHQSHFPVHWLPFDLFVELCSSFVDRSKSYRGYMVISGPEFGLRHGGAEGNGAEGNGADRNQIRPLLLLAVIAAVIVLLIMFCVCRLRSAAPQASFLRKSGQDFVHERR